MNVRNLPLEQLSARRDAAQLLVDEIANDLRTVIAEHGSNRHVLIPRYCRLYLAAAEVAGEMSGDLYDGRARAIERTAP